MILPRIRATAGRLAFFPVPEGDGQGVDRHGSQRDERLFRPRGNMLVFVFEHGNEGGNDLGILVFSQIDRGVHADIRLLGLQIVDPSMR